MQITFLIISFIVVIQTAGVRASGVRQAGNVVAVADVYYLLTLLPLMLVFFSRKWAMLPIFLTFIAVLLTGKRAGLLAIAFMLIVYYLVQARQQNRLSSYLRTLLIIVVMATLLYIIGRYLDSKYNLNIIARLERLSEDGGSGRDERWADTWAAIRASGFFDLIIGHGDNSIVRAVGGHAHNDFLEVLHDYGIIAFGFYVMFFLSLFKIGFRMVRQGYQYAAHFLASAVISLFLAIFSFFIIEPTYITGSMVSIGLILADWHRKTGHSLNTSV